MAQEPVGFHRRATSESLILSGAGRSVASRRGIPRGIAIGSSPCNNDAKYSWGFLIIVHKIANLDHFSSGLWVGFTATNPKDLASQQIDFAADVADSCVTGGEGVLWDGRDCLSVDWHSGSLREGDEVRVRFSAKGQFRVQVNGRQVLDIPKVHIPTTKPLYPLVELCGSAESVEIFPDHLQKRESSPRGAPLERAVSMELPASPSSQHFHQEPHEDPRPPPHASTPPPNGVLDPYIAAYAPVAVSPRPRSVSSGYSPERHRNDDVKLSDRFSGMVQRVRSNTSNSISPPRRSVAKAAAMQPATTSNRRGVIPTPKPARPPPVQQRGKSPPLSAPVPAKAPPQRARASAKSSKVPRAESPVRLPQESMSNDWKTQARIWTAVESCLQNPQNYSKGYWNLCREFAATRSQRDNSQAQLHQVQREATMTHSEVKRRDREVHRLKAELSQHASRLDEAAAAIEALSRKTSEAVSAKNRAQKEVRELRNQLGVSTRPDVNVLDRKINRAWETAEKVATANETGVRTEAHLRQLEATFESALCEIRDTLQRESGESAKISTYLGSTTRGAVPSRLARSSPQPSQRTLARLPRSSSSSPPRSRIPSRSPSVERHLRSGAASQPRRNVHKGRPRPMGMSASVESLGDQSTTCSSTGGVPPGMSGGLPPGPPTIEVLPLGAPMPYPQGFAWSG